jgi:hypothetical protein
MYIKLNIIYYLSVMHDTQSDITIGQNMYELHKYYMALRNHFLVMYDT